MIRLGLFAAGVRLAEWLPGPLLYAVAGPLGWLLSHVPSAARERLSCNLAHVLGTHPEAAAVRLHVRRVYHTQVTNYLDLLRARSISREEVTRRAIRCGDGWEAFGRAVAERRGLVLVTAHFGRFEILSHYIGQLGIPLTLPVERLHPPALFDLLCRLRAQPMLHIVPHDLGLRPCLRALARGEAVVVFADWDPTGGGVPVRFFGATARLPGGPALLARRAGVPLFVGLGVPADGPAYLRVLLEPPLHVEQSADFDADVQRATQSIARVFERSIGRYPEQWVMFHQIWPDVLECAAWPTAQAKADP